MVLGVEVVVAFEGSSAASVTVLVGTAEPLRPLMLMVCSVSSEVAVSWLSLPAVTCAASAEVSGWPCRKKPSPLTRSPLALIENEPSRVKEKALLLLVVALLLTTKKPPPEMARSVLEEAACSKPCWLMVAVG